MVTFGDIKPRMESHDSLTTESCEVTTHFYIFYNSSNLLLSIKATFIEGFKGILLFLLLNINKT